MAVTNWSAVNDLASFLNIANTQTADAFWAVMLYLVVGVLFFAMINFGWELALMSSLFTGMILGILLLYGGLIGVIPLAAIIATELFLFIYLVFSSNKV